MADWDLRSFIFQVDNLDEDEKELCFKHLDGQGFSSPNKCQVFFTITDEDLKSLGISLMSTRKVLLRAITGEAQRRQQAGTAVGEKDTESAVLRNFEVKRYDSLTGFLKQYRPRPLQLLPSVSKQSTDKEGVEPPTSVGEWSSFEHECLLLVNAAPKSGPIEQAVTAQAPAKVASELKLQDELLLNLFEPVYQAVVPMEQIFRFDRMRRRQDVEGVPLSGIPDFLVMSYDMTRVLVCVEVKTSAAFSVPADTSLPAAYAAAEKGSNILNCVLQVYSYLDPVPYGVLITDKQLVCFQRLGAELQCSRVIPVAGGQGELPGADEAGSLTAAAALYGIIKMSYARARMQPQPGTGTSSGGSGSAGGVVRTRWRNVLSWLPAFGAMFGVAAAADAASPDAPPPVTAAGATTGAAAGAGTPAGEGTSQGAGGRASATAGAGASLGAAAAVVESHVKSEQMFPDRPRCLSDSTRGVVLQGALGGVPAAVKLADLWQDEDGRAKQAFKHEVVMYQEHLAPLQGRYVPRLLAFGTCDGWQFFLATSLEGPPLSSEEAWAAEASGSSSTQEDISAAALAALDEVHGVGVLHGDVALRNFVLAGRRQQQQQQEPSGSGGGESYGAPRVMAVDFGHAELAAAAAKRWRTEPAAMFAGERRELQRLLLEWQQEQRVRRQMDAVDAEAAEAEAEAAAGADSGEIMDGRRTAPALW
ncbi:hypothetical protein HXX76_001425 [Chlamydomonas incerta]|uniref:Protein kinase domain-containing protein n=1 Tax=Chlamydomonas incerta TaxID=51695 RepID=A0A836B191_CHLIN|nr:hypothetical protein HXX76_001425 [Chlamydomonas incerta]|eukprot:KAG2444681.1 hypothetical protein HXX76_001425 [Chlamydomonas incerta]